MSISHWGIFPGVLWQRGSKFKWRELSFHFWCLTQGVERGKCDMWKWTDLKLSYEEAAHGVQTAIAYSMQQHGYAATDPKHLRVGVDMQKAEMGGLVRLLIDKGVFTSDEYMEYMRLAMNTELAMRESQSPGVNFR